MVYKDFHTRIEYEKYQEIEKRAKKKNVTINQEINDLISYSMDLEDILKEFKLLINIANKEYSNSKYIKRLLEQLYADIITEPSDINNSNALSNFKDNYKGSKLNE